MCNETSSCIWMSAGESVTVTMSSYEGINSFTMEFFLWFQSYTQSLAYRDFVDTPYLVSSPIETYADWSTGAVT